MKTCSKCQQTKPLTEFTKSVKKVAYSNRGAQHHAYCKTCNAELARQRRKLHKNGVKDVGKILNIPEADRDLMSALRYKFNLAKDRTKKKSLPAINLTAEDLYELYLKQGRVCAYTGLPFKLELGHELSPSLDRILPELGYVMGNVQWICWASNRAKGTMTGHDFITMCKRVVENDLASQNQLEGHIHQGEHR